MGKLIYSTLASLDGFVEDESGDIRWGAPDDEVAAFVNELERPIGTYLYGRRMYETMVFWETAGLDDDDDDDDEVGREFASIWRAANKVVFSRALTSVTSERTRIERNFNAALVERLKLDSATDLSLGGAELAGEALAVGVLDEIQLFTVPTILGGGKRALPADVRTRLRLIGTRGFAGGVVYTHYAIDR
jgi:dihydrofolate reductase